MKTIVNIKLEKHLLLLFVFLSLGCSSLWADLIEQPTMKVSGQYDIRMISSVALQPVWIRSGATTMDVIRPITKDEQMKAGRRLMHNNDLGGATGASLNQLGVLAIAPAASISSDGKTAQAGLAYTDCDNDPTTFQSSGAFLDFGAYQGCTKVYKAYLYWTGTNGATTTYTAYPGMPTMNSYPGGAVGNVTNNTTVLIKAPGMPNYEEISAAKGYTIRALSGFTDRYVNCADVTKYMQGKTGGLYMVANIKSSSASTTSAIAGWSLVVIFNPPNCPPRTIKFWDGFADVGGNGPKTRDITMNFSQGEVPASGNSVSYFGVCALDAEAYASDLMLARNYTLTQMENTSIAFSSSPGGTLHEINPFGTDQPSYTMLNDKGAAFYDDGTTPIVALKDGVLCSRISSWDDTKQTNGNDLVRLPDLTYTAGYDAHHYKLPTGSLVANASSATATLKCERSGANDCGGGYTAFMAYMAIQTLQPELKLSKKAESTTVGTSEQLTYVLTVKNIGPKANAAGSYILDSLDKTVNFVPNSVTFYDKNGNTLTPNFTVQNQGANQTAGSTLKEYLKFTLPLIAAGNGATANDSITIKFKVQLQDLSRTDIWGYGCNRYVKNKASVYYVGDDGVTQLSSGSNSGASCDGEGSYYLTSIVDATLEKQYQQTHNMTDTLTKDVNAANQANTKIYIVKTLKDSLANQLKLLNLPVSDTAKYIIYDENSVAVLKTAYFTQDVAVQTYTAQANFGSGCEETYNFTIVVAKIPASKVVAHHAPNCFKGSDGYLQIKISDGVPGYSCTVYDNSSGNVVYSANQTTASDPAYFEITNLPAGKYKIVAGDQGNIDNTGYYTLLDTTELTVSLGKDISLCAGSGTNLTAGTPGLNYVWKEKVLSATSWTDRSETTQSITVTPNETSDYIVYACNGSCQATDTVRVTVNPIPTVKLNSDTTVSTTINPMVTYHAKTKYIIGIPSFTWEMSTDNGSTWSPISPRVGESYTKVNDSTYSITGLDTLMSGYQYRVKVKDNSTTCESGTSAVTLTVTQGPKVTAESTKPSCFGLGDGTLAIHIKGGEPGETYTVTFTGPSPNMPKPVNYLAGPTGVADVVITGPAGSYTVVLTPDPSVAYPGLQTQTKYFTIEDQAPVSLTLSSDNYEVCAGNNINLTANLTGGPDGATKTYVWEQSTDNGGSYSPIAGTASSIPFALDKSSVFRVIGMVGTCPDTSNTVAVAALPTPKASIVAVTDTGCYSFDLHNLQVVETTGINDYTVTLHSAAPKNTNDNRYLIPESDYIVTKNMTVYARLTVGGLCSSTAAGNIYIKKMDQCYPIVVPEFFSPDGDGINDLFQIDNLQAYDNPEVVIYDRYGKQVFKGGKEALTPPNGWDGKYISKDLPSGDYWYEMKFKEIKTKVGHFSIKRRKE